MFIANEPIKNVPVMPPNSYRRGRQMHPWIDGCTQPGGICGGSQNQKMVERTGELKCCPAKPPMSYLLAEEMTFI